MQDELQELIERVDACENEVNSIDAAIRHYFDHHLKHWFMSEGGFTMLCAQVDRLPPTQIRTKIGMTANELRAVLDGLACHLAERHSGTSKDTYFPISKAESIFRDDGHKKMRRLHPSDQDRISGLKPWRGGHDILFPLHEADRMRKHRRLLAASGTGRLSIPEGHQGFFLHYVERTEGLIKLANEPHLIHEWKTIISAAEISPEFFIIYLEPEDLSGKEVIKFLRESLDAVRGIALEFS